MGRNGETAPSRREELMLRIALLAALIALPRLAYAADVDIVGTYRLISSNRVILDTGETEDTWGKNPVGYA
jgi:hypothetical protein